MTDKLWKDSKQDQKRAGELAMIPNQAQTHPGAIYHALQATYERCYSDTEGTGVWWCRVCGVELGNRHRGQHPDGRQPCPVELLGTLLYALQVGVGERLGSQDDGPTQKSP